VSVVVMTPPAPDPEPEPVVVATADVTVAVPLATVAETVAVEPDPPLAAETAPILMVRNVEAEVRGRDLLPQNELPAEMIAPVSVPEGHD